jgi:hypothetical protein
MLKRTKPYHTGRKTETTSHIVLQGGRGADTSNAFLWLHNKERRKKTD